MTYIDADKACRDLDPSTNWNLWVLFGTFEDGAWVNMKTAMVSDSADFSRILYAIKDDRGDYLWMVLHGDKRPFEEV